MLEPVNTVLKAVKRLSLLRGDTVLVAGQGPIGLMFTRLLKLQGMKVIATDLLESRLELARKFGARWAGRPDEVRGVKCEVRSANPEGQNPKKRQSSLLTPHFPLLTSLDAAILAVPSDAALQQALGLLRGAGQVLLFAHTKRGALTAVDLASVCVDEKDLLGSYSADFTLQREVARVVFSRRLDVRPLITHRFPLEATPAAIALATKPTPDSLKIVVACG
jgi:L-iditol 2-dehydrogenase